MRKDPIIELYKKDVDRTLLRENLKKTPTERAEALMALQRAAAELDQAGRELRARKRTERVSPEDSDRVGT